MRTASALATGSSESDERAGTSTRLARCPTRGRAGRRRAVAAGAEWVLAGVPMPAAHRLDQHPRRDSEPAARTCRPEFGGAMDLGQFAHPTDRSSRPRGRTQSKRVILGLARRRLVLDPRRLEDRSRADSSPWAITSIRRSATKRQVRDRSRTASLSSSSSNDLSIGSRESSAITRRHRSCTPGSRRGRRRTPH